MRSLYTIILITVCLLMACKKNITQQQDAPQNKTFNPPNEEVHGEDDAIFTEYVARMFPTVEATEKPYYKDGIKSPASKCYGDFNSDKTKDIARFIIEDGRVLIYMFHKMEDEYEHISLDKIDKYHHETNRLSYTLKTLKQEMVADKGGREIKLKHPAVALHKDNELVKVYHWNGAEYDMITIK